jgi:uncharacterized SAM-dependent methyltransferase
MSIATTRWNLVVPKELDKSLRQFLANYSEDGGKKGSLSRFVENAVKKQIFEATAQKIKERNANVPLDEIEAAVEESLARARAQR